MVHNTHHLKAPFPAEALGGGCLYGGKFKRKEVEKLDGEIDELVYELYGLGAKDREVIEEFLRKF